MGPVAWALLKGRILYKTSTSLLLVWFNGGFLCCLFNSRSLVLVLLNDRSRRQCSAYKSLDLCAGDHVGIQGVSNSESKIFVVRLAGFLDSVEVFAGSVSLGLEVCEGVEDVADVLAKFGEFYVLFFNVNFDLVAANS